MNSLSQLITLFCITAVSPLLSADGEDLKPLGIFDHHQDVGDPMLAGSASYDSETQTYRIKGAGKNMWNVEDQFHFAWKKIRGDFIMRATIQFVGEGVQNHRKIGIMSRDSLEKDSRYADACVHGDISTALQYREQDGEITGTLKFPVYHPTEIILERRGNTFSFSASVFGETFKSVTHEQELNEETYVGLFVCSHQEDVIEEAIFSNVRIVIPAPEGQVKYKEYLGSHLEVMDVHTGHRKILHSENRSLQAPNWTPDNRYLIYNAEGLLYKYDLEDGGIRELNTGSVKANNNDHVLSFDGKQLGISSRVMEPRASTIYTVPIEGSDNPRQITDPANGQSYLHGWSPDGTHLLFTGLRDEQWDIWSVNVSSGKETNLTQHESKDDGSEFTPDGEWIYFNSVRTGTMQIWRMKPDGSGQEQITFDSFNNWFPHISPDGKWIVYIAFPEDMDPTSHPFYKRVNLKLMPTSGGFPKTIAHLYGGQGTINVPSWSPDSRYIAFVSNTGM
ncbi:MAG: biopolymer transporter TolR [Verrucomicrobia bacterium]|nr:biopolymer transporter TolR [Verrucomicrobiota bacterium]